MTTLRFKNLFSFHVEMKSEMFYHLCILVGWMCHINIWVVKGQGRHVEDLGAASCSTWFRTGIFHSTSGIWICFSHMLTQHHSQPALESFLCIFFLLLWNWIVQCKCFEKLWGRFCIRFGVYSLQDKLCSLVYCKSGKYWEWESHPIIPGALLYR